ncbi:hypothetical protein ACFCX4_10930 [Kitasatospora sp. NPDC056327]|uniref:hypothetical protein n=1 Tax=Kitasatospora sp. NPDC056327 TaxID=3345785 RepID=UPI0035DD285A
MPTTPVRLSAAVMTHPRRAAAARDLVERFPELDLTIASDPEPDGPPTALRSARVAWESVRPGATHHLVLQDDAVPAEDLLERLLPLLEAEPKSAVCLFTEWGSRTSYAVRTAAMLGHDLAPAVDDYVPSVALVLPAELALGFAGFIRAKADTGHPDDVAMLHYLADRGTRTVVPVVNLVDHHNDVSLVGNNVHGLRSAVCLGPADPAPTAGAPYSLLTGLATVPYYDFWGQYSQACVPDASAVDGRVRTSARDALLERGVTMEHLTAGLRISLARRPESALLTDRLSEIVLTEVWIISFLLGVVTAEVDPAGGAGIDADRPVAAAALATLGPGAVRRVVPERLLPAIGALLRPLVRDAVLAGVQAVRG